MANVPILGRQARADDIHDFKKRKMLLKESNYPVRETHALVKEYALKIKDKLEGHIDKDSVLITVPSGSGRNMATLYFAQALEHLFGASIVPAGMISKVHTLEAKHSLTLDKRNVDPIGYRVDSFELKKHIPEGKKVFIVDDVIGTGESAIKLKIALERDGIKVHGLANMITVENRYPTPGDMNRLAHKIDTLINLPPVDKIALQQDIFDAFSSYTRQKINRLERTILSAGAALKSLNVIRQTAELERNLRPVFGKIMSKEIGHRNELSY